jgi:rSAM/selenodomain-associated transferase 1
MRRLIVFGRLPARGRVKTRLAAGVGEARALAVHVALLERTLALGEAGGWTREFRHPDGERAAHPLLDALAARGWTVAAQRGADLGARMHEALAAALADGERPVLVGSDCPVLGRADLEAAFAALEGPDAADAVFAPAEDGGYALVGVSRPLPALFEGIAWGTSGVMAATRARLAACGARAVALRTVWDVDLEADLRRWEREGGAPA